MTVDAAAKRVSCLVAGVAPGAEVVHPDPDGAVRRRGRCGEPARERRVGSAQAEPAAGARQRRERRGAAEAGVAVERLGPRHLRAAAREQVGAKRRGGRARPAGGEDRLDEVAAGVVASLRAVGRVRVAGLRRGR